MIALAFVKRVTVDVTVAYNNIVIVEGVAWEMLVGMYLVEIGEICASIPPTHGFQFRSIIENSWAISEPRTRNNMLTIS